MDAREDLSLGALIRDSATRHAAPDALAERIHSQLREHVGPAAAAAPTPPVRRVPAWRRWIEGAGLYGAGLATAWVAASALRLTPPPDDTARQATANHVRSLLADHLADVRSSDRHTVKPWFAGKLDFSPPVIDLAAEGFPLTGGRLDYLDGRTVAALVYKPGAHVVNLFVWPAPQHADTAVSRPDVQQGYNLVHWSANGMQAWAVSDMAVDELQTFATLLRTRMRATDAAGP